MEMENKIVTIVQTRCGSSRLPNKVLLPLADQPLFIRMHERLMASKLAGTIVIATTTNKKDDVIEELCLKANIPYYRGHETDLLDRYYWTALVHEADIIVKIPSDCPLIDPKIIDNAIQYYLDNDFDFVSNLHPASYPDGNDIEVFSMNLLEDAWANAMENYEREHATPFFWDNPDKFNIGNVSMDDNQDYSMTHRFTIDYQEDYDFIKKVYDELYPINPMFGLDEIMNLLSERKDIHSINHHLAGINWYRNHLKDLKTVDASHTKVLAE